MANNRFRNRLQSLFESIEPETPLPSDRCPEPVALPQPLPAWDHLHSTSWNLPLPYDEAFAQSLVERFSTQSQPEESSASFEETRDITRRLTEQSWQIYLEQSDQTDAGFLYEKQTVQPLPEAAELRGEIFDLRVRESVIGQLAVEVGASAEEDASSLVSVIADRLSAHLEGLRLAEQRELALAETEMLYSVSARLSTAQSLEEALISVSEPAQFTNAADSRLFFITLDQRGAPEGLSLAAVWIPGGDAQVVGQTSYIPLADFPAYGDLLQHIDRPMLIDDTQTDPRLSPAARDLFSGSQAQAAAVLPLSVNGRWVGLIVIHWDSLHKFADQERRMYASLARQAAVVVNNRLLFEQTRKRAQELQTVAQVSTAASTILDPDALLQAVVDLTKTSFNLYHTQVYRCQPGSLQIAAGSSALGRQIAAQGSYIPFDSPTPAARAARERQVVVINDTSSEPGSIPHPLLPDVRSEMAIPMIVGERLQGIFHLQSSTSNRFTREDARTFNTLAAQVAVALQNAELYAEQAATVERLRELDHLKSAFLANMSHELRTPLNSILGFSEVLLLGLDGPLTETMDNDVRLIEKNGKHLLSLINDVLDMAKIEAGKMNLSYDRFVLRDLIDETIDITGSLAREKNLSLRVEAASDDRLSIQADRVRLRQVLINIISNAVKFTERGGISICTTQFPGIKRLQIRFQDTGIGIPADKVDMVFESFSQVDTSTTRKSGGTGLGLPISRRLIEMHGGRLWAESSGVPGEGAAFIVELPFEAVKPF